MLPHYDIAKIRMGPDEDEFWPIRLVCLSVLSERFTLPSTPSENMKQPKISIEATRRHPAASDPFRPIQFQPIDLRFQSQALFLLSVTDPLVLHNEESFVTVKITKMANRNSPLLGFHPGMLVERSMATAGAGNATLAAVKVNVFKISLHCRICGGSLPGLFQQLDSEGSYKTPLAV